MAAVDAMEDYDEDDQYDQEMKEMEERKKKSAKKESKRPSDKKAVPEKDDKSDNYSSDSDKGDVRFMDINDLKRNQSQDKKADSDEEAYEEDEFAWQWSIDFNSYFNSLSRKIYKKRNTPWSCLVWSLNTFLQVRSISTTHSCTLSLLTICKVENKALKDLLS